MWMGGGVTLKGHIARMYMQVIIFHSYVKHVYVLLRKHFVYMYFEKSSNRIVYSEHYHVIKYKTSIIGHAMKKMATLH